jgi:antitoxin VapB
VALSIKDARTDRLVRELARETGESMTVAVAKAAAERLSRERAKRGRPGALAAELIAIGDHCAALPDRDPRSPDEIVGYDENGMW